MQYSPESRINFIWNGWFSHSLKSREAVTCTLVSPGALFYYRGNWSVCNSPSISVMCITMKMMGVAKKLTFSAQYMTIKHRIDNVFEKWPKSPFPLLVHLYWEGNVHYDWRPLISNPYVMGMDKSSINVGNSEADNVVCAHWSLHASKPMVYTTLLILYQEGKLMNSQVIFPSFFFLFYSFIETLDLRCNTLLCNDVHCSK